MIEKQLKCCIFNKGDTMGKAYWYTTQNGRSPVEEGINDLPVPDQAKVYAYISKLEEMGYRLGAPFVKPIEGKLRELRILVAPGQYRVFFFFHHGEDFYLLHGFLKKTQKTPPKEIETAKKRMNQIKGGRT
jgi:phage-related protein